MKVGKNKNNILNLSAAKLIVSQENIHFMFKELTWFFIHFRFMSRYIYQNITYVSSPSSDEEVSKESAPNKIKSSKKRRRPNYYDHFKKRSPLKYISSSSEEEDSTSNPSANADSKTSANGDTESVKNTSETKEEAGSSLNKIEDKLKPGTSGKSSESTVNNNRRYSRKRNLF